MRNTMKNTTKTTTKALLCIMAILVVMLFALPVAAQEVETAVLSAPGVVVDATPLVSWVLTLLAALVSGFVIPWIRKNTTAKQQEYIAACVNILVMAAEKLYSIGEIADKLAYVERTLLEVYGIKLDTQTLQAQVNAAIKAMEMQEGVGLEYTMEYTHEETQDAGESDDAARQ